MNKKFTSFSRLSEALLGLSKSDQLDTISFDIFDTLIHRRMSPDLVIEGVALALRQVFQEYNIRACDDLLHSRHLAYMKVASVFEEQGLDLDLTLDELAPVWVEESALDPLHQSVIEEIANRIVLLEVEYEQRVCYPNYWLSNTLDTLKQKGFKLICISDMYLGEKYIDFLLQASGLREHFSEIYVSGDVRLLKRTGRLFDYVAEKENLNTATWLHIGDNAIADGLCPRRKGIKSWIINDDDLHGAYRMQKYDHQIYSRSKDWSGVVAASYAQLDHNQKTTEVEAYGRRVFGPVFANFIHGVLEQCKENNAGRVFFFAREGQLLKKLYQKLKPVVFKDGGAPEAVYLGMSRLTVFIASLHGYGLRHIAAAMANTGEYTLRSLFSPLRISEEMLRGLAAKNDIDDIDAPLPHNFLSWPALHRLIDEPELQIYIEEKSDSMRGLLTEYLEQMGFFDYQTVAVVDVGWSGQIQDNLYSSIRNRADAPKILGLYLGITEQAHERSCESSQILSIVSDQVYAGWSADAVFEFVFAYEAASRAPHGTTIGYERVVVDGQELVAPSFRSDDVKSRQEEMCDDGFISMLQSGICDFTESYLECATILKFNSGHTRSYARSMLDRMVRYPTKSESKWWLQVKNVSDLGSEEVLTLGFGYHNNGLFKNLLSLKSLLRRVFWRYGLLSYVGGKPMQILFMVMNNLRTIKHRRLDFSHQLIKPEAKDINDADSSGRLHDPEQFFEKAIEDNYQQLLEQSRNKYNQVCGYDATRALTFKELLMSVLAYRLVKLISKIRRRNFLPYDGIHLRSMMKRELFAKYEVDRPVDYIKSMSFLKPVIKKLFHN